MHLEEVEGIVTSETNYSETSKIINVITKEHELIGIMAKGARSLKSPFRSVTSKLTYGKFIIYYKENKLSTLKEVSIINSFKNLKKDIIYFFFFFVVMFLKILTQRYKIISGSLCYTKLVVKKYY